MPQWDTQALSKHPKYWYGDVYAPAKRGGKPDAEHVARLLLCLAILPDVTGVKGGQVVVQEDITCNGCQSDVT